MHYALVKPLGKTTERYLCALPKKRWLCVGDYVIYIGERGDERIGIVATPDFEADDSAIKAVWNCPVNNIVAELNRLDIEWPDDALTEPIPEID